jgi:hypothetical protein
MKVREVIALALSLLSVDAYAGTYAVVSPRGTVLNLILWDGTAAYDVRPNTLVAVNGNANAKIGGTYSKGTFTAPTVSVTATQVPTLSACGTSPTIDPQSTNALGAVTVGSGVVNSCTITFANGGYTTSLVGCNVVPMTSAVGFAYTVDNTKIVVTAVSLTSTKLFYTCGQGS